MKKNDILNTFKSLSRSQGFYGRLLNDYYNGDEGANEFIDHLASQNFQDEIDLILAVEC